MDVQSADTAEKETIRLDPYLAMNDYAGLAAALVDGRGMGYLPPMCSPGFLLRDSSWKSCPPGTSVPSSSRSFILGTVCCPATSGSF